MKIRITAIILMLLMVIPVHAETVISEKPPVTLPNTLGELLYKNDFENDDEAVEFGGSKALCVTDSVCFGDSSWGNYSFDFNITITEQEATQEEFTVIKFRYVDEFNYYSLSFRRGESSIVLRKMTNGRLSWLSNPALYIGVNYTQHFRIEVFEDKIRLYQKRLTDPDMEFPVLNYIDKATSFKSGGIIIEKPDVVDGVYVDNVTIYEILQMHELGERTMPKDMLTFKDNPADAFTDIDFCAGKNAIRLMVGRGLIDGYCCNKYNPYYAISMADFVEILRRSLAYKSAGNISSVDFDKILGQDSGRAVTRYEAAQVLYEGLLALGGEVTLASPLDIADYDAIPQQYQTAVAAMYGSGIMTGDGNGVFAGDQQMTREVTAIVYARLLEDGFRVKQNYVIVNPAEYDHAFKNPLKGFASVDKNKYTTLHRHTVYWSELEQTASDGIEKIIEYSEKNFAGYAERNIKIIPQIVLDGVAKGTYWPDDMRDYDYSSPQFLERVEGLIKKVAAVWDNDPRIAFVLTAIFGKWGESADPLPTIEAQNVVGNAFKKYFKNKLVIAHGGLWLYTNFDFGVNWDSYGHFDNTHFYDFVAYSDKYKDRWKTAPWGGETAFDWGNMVGKDPSDSVLNYHHWWLQVLRFTHCTYLGWLAGYDDTVPEISANGEILQKNLGYRFVLEQVQYPAQIQTGGDFDVKFAVKNKGVAPIYYNWGVSLSLLDKTTHEVVYEENFQGLDIRKWLPDDDYSDELIYSETGTFTLPADIPTGEYILAFSINDPLGGNLPAVRFANTNYFNGGRHPIGIIGVNCTPAETRLDPNSFDDIYSDQSLYYGNL